MWGSLGGKLGALILATLAIGLAACDDDGDDETSANDAVTAADLDRFLMQDGEEPGFRQGALPGAVPKSRETITGVKAVVKDEGLGPADARRLRSEGFISVTFQPIRGPRTAGVSSVFLFATEEGAERHMAHESRTDVIREFVTNIRRFTVPGIPSARGFTAFKRDFPASDPLGRIGDVSWVQGRCVLSLGNQGPGPFVGPLSTGARAIYERTNGECP